MLFRGSLVVSSFCALFVLVSPSSPFGASACFLQSFAVVRRRDSLSGILSGTLSSWYCPCLSHYTVPCLHGAVELLLTGDQHKPCACFNQQACKNTTSVAEGKRKTAQKIASHRFGVQKWTRFGVCHYFFKQTSPQNGSIFGPQNGGIFCVFLCLLMQFFAGFSVCLLLRMLYSYMPVD